GALLRTVAAAVPELPAGVRLDVEVIGDGPLRASMERFIRRNRLGDVVTLAGHLPRPEVARRLAEADLYVAPATLESFGIAALEACAVGIPVIGLAGTGLSEFVNDGDG